MCLAHRQIPVAECDWRLLGCQVKVGGPVYINKVGTFGIASVSYWWSRVAAALGRLSQYLVGPSATTWLVADDFHLEAGGESYRQALFAFFSLCAVAGVPLSCGKTAGGDVVAWVGYELLQRTYQLGITERRALWFVRWTQDVAKSQVVSMAKIRGRTGQDDGRGRGSGI